MIFYLKCPPTADFLKKVSAQKALRGDFLVFWLVNYTTPPFFFSNYSYEGLTWPWEWFLSISGNKHFLPLLVFGDLPAENFFFFSIILLNLYFYRNAQYWWHMKGISISHIVTATFSIFWNFEFSQTKISMNFFNVLGVENSKCQKIEKIALLLYVQNWDTFHFAWFKNAFVF